MTIEEEMNAMIAGNYTSDVMQEEPADTEQSGQTESSTDEIEDETAGAAPEAEVAEEQSEENTGSDEGNTAEGTTEDGEKSDEGEGENGVAQDAGTEEDGNKSDEEDTQPDEGKDVKPEKKEDEPEQKVETDEYKTKYESLMQEMEDLKSFRDKVTKDFKANGKQVKGLTDPDKILKSIQRNVGLSEKLEGYKKVKHLLKPLMSRGLVEDTAKFDMLMKLADGDDNAVKHYLKGRSIDPLDLDMDEIAYDDSTTITPEGELQFEEMQDMAANYGVADRFTSTVLDTWDTDSTAVLFGDKGTVVANRLAEQMSNGIYDQVMAIAENMKLTEPTFGQLSSIDQYEAASNVYNQQIEVETKAEQAAKEAESAKLAKIEAEKAAIEKARAEREYAEKAAKEKAEREAKRDAAVQASKPRTQPTPAKGSSEPKDFRDSWRKLMAQ